jgi:hypothetical protein
MNAKTYSLIEEIFHLCMRINSETKLACWFDISGHVYSMEVEIARGKKKFKDRFFECRIYFPPSTIASPIEKYKELIKTLKEYLGDKNE